MEEAFKKSDVEILLSTMNRNSLDFLVPMFPFAHFSDFNILIINQTTEDNILISDYPNVRVINTFERGLSKSRNLALKNSNQKIILLADDDVSFNSDFEVIISRSFNSNPDAAALRFMVSDKKDKIYKKYPRSVKSLGYLDIMSSMSIEIALNREIVNDRFLFDEHFGLGTKFPLGEEHILLADVKQKKLSMLSIPEVIVKHDEERDSSRISLELKYRTVGAYFTRMFPKNYHFWLFVFVLFNLKGKRLPPGKVAQGFAFAGKGRTEYLQMA